MADNQPCSAQKSYHDFVEIKQGNRGPTQVVGQQRPEERRIPRELPERIGRMKSLRFMICLLTFLPDLPASFVSW
jgi:hypothetical protein